VVVSSIKSKYAVLGPEEPAISRIRNEYRTIIIKIPQKYSDNKKNYPKK
jgi:hypothetical protein